MSADNSPIKVGDLVQVVRWDCCGSLLGNVYEVTKYFDTSGYRVGRCKDCQKLVRINGRQAFKLSNGRIAYRNEIKRIPPLSELEGQRTEESLRLPRKEPA